MSEAWTCPIIVTVEVELVAFGDHDVRPVDVPGVDFVRSTPPHQLELVFQYGQNDFQPKPFRSVSVGDVIRLHGLRYRVEGLGFTRL